MKIFDKYTLRSFVGFLGWAFVAFLTLFYVVDIVENLDKFIDKNARFADVFLYYLTYMPFVIVLVSPIAVLLSANFSCGQMSKHREIIAIRSNGISSLRIAFPLLIFGFVWSLAMMGFAEFIVPETTALRDKIKTERIEKKSPRSQLKTRNILYLTGDGRVFSIGFLDPKKGFARDILIVAFGNDDKIKELIRAREMNFNGKKWTLKDGHKYNFTADYSAAPDNPDEEVYERFSEKDIFIRETPQELAARRADPNEMGFFELRDFIKRVEKAGGRPIAEKTDLIMKISYPFINFIILLFGVPLVLRFRRGGMVYGFAQSVTIAFLYFAAIRVGQTLGYNATLPPYVAATLGNALFGTCGFVLLLTFRE